MTDAIALECASIADGDCEDTTSMGSVGGNGAPGAWQDRGNAVVGVADELYVTKNLRCCSGAQVACRIAVLCSTITCGYQCAVVEHSIQVFGTKP